MSNSIFQLTVSKPCTEDWSSMNRVGAGRYCCQCDKVVHDFTSMSDEDIKAYFLNRRGDESCGRFRNEQLQRVRIQLPSYILDKRIRSWKKYLVILLLCFGATLFNLDVIIGSAPSLYAQSEIPLLELKKVPVKKKNKKKQSGYKHVYPVIQYTIETMGVVGTIEIMPKLPIIFSPASVKEKTASSIPEADTTALMYDHCLPESNRKVPRPNSNPFSRKEYIIPGNAVVKRRRRSR